jgi:hypothetical protein
MAGFGVRPPVDLGDDIPAEERQRQAIIDQERDIINEEKRERAMKIQAIAASDPTAEIKEETRNLFHDRLIKDGFSPSVFDNMLKISGAIVAGGYPLQVFSKQSWPSDIDLWIPSPNNGGHPEHVYRYLMDLGYTPRRMSLRCSNLRATNVNLQTCEMDYMRFKGTVDHIVAFYKPDAIVVQLITLRNNLSPVDMVKTFDLDICQVMYMDETISFTEQGLSEKILTKRAAISQAALNLQSTYEWFRTFKRIDKYMMRGYTVDIAPMLKVLSIQIPKTVHSLNTLARRENFMWTWNRNATFNLMATLRMPLFVPSEYNSYLFAYVKRIPENFSDYLMDLNFDDVTEVVANFTVRTLTYHIINKNIFDKLSRTKFGDLFALEVPVKEFKCNLPDRPEVRDWYSQPVYIQGIDICLTVKDILEPIDYLSGLNEFTFYDKSPETVNIFNKLFFDIDLKVYFKLTDQYAIRAVDYVMMYRAVLFNFNRFEVKRDKTIDGYDGSQARFNILGDEQRTLDMKRCSCSLIKNAIEPTPENIAEIMKEMFYYRPHIGNYINRDADVRGLQVCKSLNFDPEDKNIFLQIRLGGTRHIVVISQAALTPYLAYDTAVNDMRFPTTPDVGIAVRFPFVMFSIVQIDPVDRVRVSLPYCFPLVDIYKLINMPSGTGCSVLPKAVFTVVKASNPNGEPIREWSYSISQQGFTISPAIQAELIEAAKAI